MARIDGAISAGDNLSGFVRHRWAVALTEVLKVIAEDKASKTVDKITASMVRMGVIGEASSAKFGRKLENMFGDVIVGGATAAIGAFAALATAGVAGLTALTVSSLKAQIAYDKMRESFGGGTSEFLGASRDMEAAYDRLQESIAGLIINQGQLPDKMNKTAEAVENIAKAIDEQDVSIWTKFVKVARQLPGWSNPVSAGLALGDAINPASAGAAGGLPPGTIRLPTQAVPMPKLATQAEKDAALDKRIQAEVDAANEINDYNEAMDRARYERALRMRERFLNQIKEKEMRAAEAEAYARDAAADRGLEAYANGIREREAIREKAEDDAALAAQNLEAARDAQTAMVTEFAAQTATVGTFWKVMNDGAATSADRMRGVLGLIGGLGGFFLNLIAPGAGSALSALTSTAAGFFQDGGVVRAAGGMRVPGVGSGDRVPALLERGETIIPNGASHPDFLQEVAMAAGGGRSNTVVINNGYIVPPTITQTKRAMTAAVIPALSELAQNGRARIQDPRIKGSARGRRV